MPWRKKKWNSVLAEVRQRSVSVNVARTLTRHRLPRRSDCILVMAARAIAKPCGVIPQSMLPAMARGLDAPKVGLCAALLLVETITLIPVPEDTVRGNLNKHIKSVH